MKRWVIVILTALVGSCFGYCEPPMSISQRYYTVDAIADTTIFFPLDPDAASVTFEIRGGLVKHRHDNGQSWGVIWGDYPTHYYIASLSRDNTGSDDYAGRVGLQLEIGEWVDHECIRPVSSIRLTDNVSTRKNGRNSLQITFNTATGDTEVYVGYKSLHKVAAMRLDYEGGATMWGVKATGPMEVSLAGIETRTPCNDEFLTSWSASAIDTRLSRTTDPLEGYYEYFDRDTDNSLARLGGRYRIAIVGNADDSYDIIYISGAEVGAADWHTGMLRGRLTPTIFTGNYRLLWYDASFQPLESDCFATFEQQALLSLNFPELKSVIRFAKDMRR